MTSINKLAAQDVNYYPLKSSQVILDFIPRIRGWLDALERPDSRYSRWQVAKDLTELAMLVAYDDGQQIGKVTLARELLKAKKKYQETYPLAAEFKKKKKKGK